MSTQGNGSVSACFLHLVILTLWLRWPMARGQNRLCQF